MKTKLLLFPVSLCFLLTQLSCKKDYVCACTWTNATGGTGVEQLTYQHTYHINAVSDCGYNQVYLQSLDSTRSYSCGIK